MAEVADLQDRIDKATVEIDKSYRKALKAVEKLKEKINELELSVSQNGYAKASEDIDALNSAIKSLDRLTDSLILRSNRTWNKYEKLENGCKAIKFEPAGLEDLRVLCKKTEELAANLLCYSLGRIQAKGE